MKMKAYVLRTFYVLVSTAIVFSSCQKNDLPGTDDPTSNTIAVAATSTAGTTNSAAPTDSVYLLQSCGRGGSRGVIAQSALPASVSSYLTTNYPGATFSKAVAIKNSSSTVTGYVVVVYYNDNPVGLQFDNGGTFVKVLEQREKSDLNGSGHHRGGRFEHRDGGYRDTITLTALPSSITGYFAANYPGDTLIKAFKNRDSSIVVLSRNSGAFATVFTALGTFVKRTQLNTRTGNCQSIELSALPSVAANYLATTYPNYVFEKAFSITQASVIKGYVVFIDANNTKYAVEFDASGNFVQAKTVH
ncbi:MAG: hypothetical protein JWR72_923 [Flavisolibacter sp.]|nr:hypothetical protein [Flavisolibacter sp.]